MAISGKEIAAAAAVIIPLVAAFIEAAEGSGASSEDKHKAVASAAEGAYVALQNSGGVKEVKDVPWELIAPIILPVATGMISIIVGFFKSIGRFFSRGDSVKK